MYPMKQTKQRMKTESVAGRRFEILRTEVREPFAKRVMFDYRPRRSEE